MKLANNKHTPPAGIATAKQKETITLAIFTLLGSITAISVFYASVQFSANTRNMISTTDSALASAQRSAAGTSYEHAFSVPSYFYFDPESVRGASYKDVEGIKEDGTYFLLRDFHNVGPNENCMNVVKQKDRIKRIHYHYSSCTSFDRQFGNRLGTVYGMKMIANALRVPFKFTCGIDKRKTVDGAEFLMTMNRFDNIGPAPNRNGVDYAAEDVCERFCRKTFCSWYSPNLDLVSDEMIADWRFLTQPELVPLTDHDDAVIHLRLGDGLHSTYGANEAKGVFPHATYVKLLKNAQEEVGELKSIGILTSPFEGERIRSWDKEHIHLSSLIARDLLDVLQKAFPQAKVRLRNGPEQTIMESMSRLVNARLVAVCGCSTFCPYAVLATKGIGYMYNPLRAQNQWVRNAAKRYKNLRLFDAPMLNGLMIDNKKLCSRWS